MIRRHITPALLFFVLLLGCCLARALPVAHWRLLLAVAVVPGTLAVVLLSLPSPLQKRSAVLALSACAGLLFGALSAWRMSGDSLKASLPVPTAEISGFSGVLSEDSTFFQKGFTVLRVILRSAASTRRGVQGAARGSVIVFLEETTGLPWVRSCRFAHPLPRPSGPLPLSSLRA
jgi:hypothetical protein